MIALGLALAVAGAVEVDVLYDQATLQTGRMVPRLDAPKGWWWAFRWDDLDEARLRDDYGVAVEVLAPTLRPREQWLVSLTGRTQRQRWREGGVTFEPRLVDAMADVGVRVRFSERPRPIDGYVSGGIGLHAAILTLPPWPITLAPSPHGFLAIGAGNFDHRLRVRAEARLGIALRTDNYLGSAELPSNTLIWRFIPGHALLSVRLGIGVAPGPRRSQGALSASRPGCGR